MRYFSALCARMYRFKANSRATISSTAIFLSQQSRQYFSSPRGSETSLALQSAQRACARDFRGMPALYQFERAGLAAHGRAATPGAAGGYAGPPTPALWRSAGAYIVSTYSFTMRRALNLAP